jgi:hypothetical protein
VFTKSFADVFEVIFMVHVFLAPPSVEEETSRTLNSHCACAQKLELLEVGSVPVGVLVSFFHSSLMALKFSLQFMFGMLH